MRTKLEAGHTFTLINRSEKALTGDAMLPFAMEDVLCRYVGKTGKPVLHFWRHAHALILGLRDRRLPEAAEAMSFFRNQGCSVIVRHSGGALVPLNEDVLNISLILPKSPGVITDFHKDFGKMVHLLQAALGKLGMQCDVGEIADSYCPGDYDLSYGGRKFCGIAQRRQLHAFVIQAFVNIGGNGMEKGETARHFYELASGLRVPREKDVLTTQSKRPFVPPKVRPEVITTLSEVAGRPVSVQEVASAVIEFVAKEVGIACTVDADSENAGLNDVFAADLDWRAEAEALAEKLHGRYDD